MILEETVITINGVSVCFPSYVNIKMTTQTDWTKIVIEIDARSIINDDIPF